MVYNLGIGMQGGHTPDATEANGGVRHRNSA